MNAATKAWIVATSIGAVEALKDQGICRWNYTIRSLHQYAKNNMKSFAEAKMLSSQAKNSSLAAASAAVDELRVALMKKREKSMEKVLGLSAWGPGTVRF